MAGGLGSVNFLGFDLGDAGVFASFRDPRFERFLDGVNGFFILFTLGEVVGCWSLEVPFGDDGADGVLILVIDPVFCAFGVTFGDGEAALDEDEVAIEDDDDALVDDEVALDDDEVALDDDEVALDDDELAFDDDAVALDDDDVAIDDDDDGFVDDANDLESCGGVSVNTCNDS